MNESISVVAGHYGSQRCAPRGTIATLTLDVAARARATGLVVVRMLASRVSNSASKHLQLRDRHNRLWHVRISDHLSPTDSGYCRPHFALVSRDGVAGRQELLDFIDRSGRNEEPWAPAEETRQRRGCHVRGQKYAYRSGS
jgi:hypothetical protein